MTDTIEILGSRGEHIDAIVTEDSRDTLGVNNLLELADAAAIMRKRILKHLMLRGVCITDPENTYVDVDVEVGRDTILEPGTMLGRGTRIGSNCIIGPNTRIERSTIGDSVIVTSSQVVESILMDGVKVGPFSNLRPGTVLGPRVKIGDFVEVKNSIFGEGAQASHLAYIGDADVGTGTNIGAGTITCNYDGYRKSRTVIGKNAFVGSHSTLIAPVTIGDGAFIAAGSPITSDVPENALAIARMRATVKPGWAAKYRSDREAE